MISAEAGLSKQGWQLDDRIIAQRRDGFQAYMAAAVRPIRHSARVGACQRRSDIHAERFPTAVAQAFYLVRYSGIPRGLCRAQPILRDGRPRSRGSSWAAPPAPRSRAIPGGWTARHARRRMSTKIGAWSSGAATTWPWNAAPTATPSCRPRRRCLQNT